jgi:tRNA pseudouridine55 synthase
MGANTHDGLLVIDKPRGMTSRAVVDRVLRWFPRGTKIGHTGTLDPLATGVLVLCVGSATRLAEYVQRMAKTYHGTFRLGARSDTDDADGQISPVAGVIAPSEEAVHQALGSFLGTTLQIPPAYSAAKVTGQRAYALARQGAEVALQPRPVQVYAIEVLHYTYPDLDVEVRCGKGTYIRSLARDLGEKLGCGAYVQALRRTQVGPFRAVDGLALDAGGEAARARLLPAAQAVAELPRLTLPNRDLQRLRGGQEVPLPELNPAGADFSGEGEVGVFDHAGHLVAVGVLDLGRWALRAGKMVG